MSMGDWCPIFDKTFLTKLLLIAQFDPFEIIFDKLMNFDDGKILIYDLFEDFNQVFKKQVERNFGQILGGFDQH